jgi:CRP-like cAMP-binding protein
MGQRVALVERFPLFTDITSAECAAIVSSSHERNYLRREKIFLERDPITQVMLLTAGCVKEMQYSKNGGEVILRLDGPGELVGPASASEKGHCSAAQAIHRSKALVWGTDTFNGFVVRFPTLQRNTARILDGRLAAMQQRFREVSTDTVASRVSNELLRLLNQMGQRVNGHVRISLSREELAQLTATSLFTVSRLLSKWEEHGIIKPVRGAVLVRNIPALRQVAQIESRYSVRSSDNCTDKPLL